MTKLITETPDHPIPFLIDHLQTKQDSPGKLHRALSGSAALWAQSSPGWYKNKWTALPTVPYDEYSLRDRHDFACVTKRNDRINPEFSQYFEQKL